MASYGGDALLLDFDEKPTAIIAAIDGLRQSWTDARARLKGAWQVPLGLVFLGMALVVLDIWLGYGRGYFVRIGVITVLIGFWTAIRLARARRQPKFDRPEIGSARRVIHTLRDDVSPQGNFHGTLDLTGLGSPDKVARTTKDSRGRRISYHRDEWLTLKAKLYDGSMLRFSVIHRAKIRNSYYKRSRISGKQKLKPEVLKKDVQVIDVRVSPNPALYELRRERAPVVGARVGACVVDSVSTDGGLLRVTASGAHAPSADDILEILRVTYATLQRKDAA
jgi:hypothetical protein